jgi:hypothetical protein
MRSFIIVRLIGPRRIRWTGHLARVGNMRNAYKVLVGKHKGKKLLGIPRRKREDNIRINIREIMSKGVDWIHLAQDRDQWWAVVNMVMNLWVPNKVGNFVTN